MDPATEKEKLKEQKSEFEKVIKDVFEGILESYLKMVNNINSNHFNILEEFMKNELHVKLQAGKTASVFKMKLVESLKRSLTTMWEVNGMDCSVVTLEISKREAALQGNCDWRPTNLSCKDQARMHMYKMLTKQKNFMLDQIAQQEAQIAELVAKNEYARKVMRTQMEKRASILARIEVDRAKIKETHCKIDEVIDSQTLF